MKWNNLRKWCRNIHRDLSFFFAGMIMIYAISGIALNHRRDFNVNYSVAIKEYPLDKSIQPDCNNKLTKDKIICLLQQYNEADNYVKHYMPNPSTLKVFLKGGSSIVIDYVNNKVVYEKLSKRPILSSLAFLHYNAHKWWIIFSDIFAIALIVITLTGCVILKGRKGFLGMGGIEFLLGIIIPLIFIFLV